MTTSNQNLVSPGNNIIPAAPGWHYVALSISTGEIGLDEGSGPPIAWLASACLVPVIAWKHTHGDGYTETNPVMPGFAYTGTCHPIVRCSDAVHGEYLLSPDGCVYMLPGMELLSLDASKWKSTVGVDVAQRPSELVNLPDGQLPFEWVLLKSLYRTRHPELAEAARRSEEAARKQKDPPKKAERKPITKPGSTRPKSQHH